MACDYCAYRYSYDCDDGWNRHKNCKSFKLDWDSLSEKDKKTIRKPFRKFWIEEETKLWKQFRKMNSGN